MMSWDLDGGFSLFPIIGDRRTIRPTPCRGSIMDDESPEPLVPEEKEPSLTGFERMRAQVMSSFEGRSDAEIIASLHLSKQHVRVAGEFELQRRFVDRLTRAMASGTYAAWALVAGTAILGVATILLVIAAW